VLLISPGHIQKQSEIFLPKSPNLLTDTQQALPFSITISSDKLFGTTPKISSANCVFSSAEKI
jgi:hypothetical protein